MRHYVICNGLPFATGYQVTALAGEVVADQYLPA